jgi:protein-tyrosine-phosphatase
MKTSAPRRRFKLRIWWLALGYFVFYAPYSFLIKMLTTESWPGVTGTVSGFRILPAVALSTALVLPAIITVKGWWQHAHHREVFGLRIPWPSPRLIVSGLGTALIIGATTLTFTFTGISILFALLLMRGGVLILAPSVDLIFGRRVRWFSWAALGLTVPALLLALLDVNNYHLTAVAELTIAAYLGGYLLRLPCVTALAKIEDKNITRGYFVEESLVAVIGLVTIPAIFAVAGQGPIMLELRQGFLELFTGNLTIPAIAIGVLYAGLYCFGTLIYLDCRENTFCIPLNRGSSLLAGVVATYALALLLGELLPSSAQLAGASLIVLALLLLSPLHHQVEHYFARLRKALASLRPRWSNSEAQPVTPALARQRLFLFVCSGNTCRSPMAAAIANAQIAARMGVPFEELETVNVRAASAGVSARVGAPLTPEAQEVLRSLSVPFGPHAARNLTLELAEEAEMIFCLTSGQRTAVVEMFPAVAGKTYCLDTEADVADPIGKGMPAYVACARQIQDLIRLRFDALNFAAESHG